MYSDTGNTTSLVLGFPIRTSSDQRSVDSSPRHIAASHVLHRPLMPRHPPCALKHLQTQKPIVKNRNYTTTTHNDADHPKEARHRRELMLATTIHESNTTPHHQNLGQQHASHPTPGPRRNGPVVSQPNSVLGSPPDPTPQRRAAPAFFEFVSAPDPHPLQASGHLHESLGSP